MRQEMLEFLASAKKLTEVWTNEQSLEYPKEPLKDYPFEKSFDDLVGDIEVWVENYLFNFEKMEFEAKLGDNKDEFFAMSIKEFSDDNGAWTEDGWFFCCSYKNGLVDIVEEIGSGNLKATVKQFKDNFIIVDKNLYELYIKLNNEAYSDEITKLQEIAKSMAAFND